MKTVKQLIKDLESIDNKYLGVYVHLRSVEDVKAGANEIKEVRRVEKKVIILL